MTLREFLVQCRKMIDENPESLDMEIVTIHGPSGAVEEMSSLHIKKISEWSDNEFPIEEYLPKNYPFDKFLWVYIGN